VEPSSLTNYKTSKIGDIRALEMESDGPEKET